MSEDRHATPDRRTFVKASLVPATYPLTAWASRQDVETDEPEEAAGPPEIVDTNVHLFEWPFRKLKYQRTETLLAKLRKHRIAKAWAGSFEAVFHKQLDASNRRLAEECKTRGGDCLVPIGCVNPVWPNWDEDLRRCHHEYGISGLRLYPSYHGYAFDDPQFVRLLRAATKRHMLIQIALRLEDERVHHPAFDVPKLNVAPLVEVLKSVPQAKVQLINSAGSLLGNSVSALVAETQVTFDIAATEGNGGIGRLIAGTNPGYRGAIPASRLLYGSHMPFFPCESALLKLFESPLDLEQLVQVMHGNAERVMGESDSSR